MGGGSKGEKRSVKAEIDDLGRREKKREWARGDVRGSGRQPTKCYCSKCGKGGRSWRERRGIQESGCRIGDEKTKESGGFDMKIKHESECILERRSRMRYECFVKKPGSTSFRYVWTSYAC